MSNIRVISKALASRPTMHQTQLTIRAGGSTELHRHTDTHETYVVLRGNGLIKVGNRAHQVQSGGYIEIPRNTPHQILNTTNEILVVVSTKDRPINFQDYHTY